MKDFQLKKQFSLYRKLDLENQIRVSNKILHERLLEHWLLEIILRKRRQLMKLMVEHLRQIPRFRLTGGAGGNPASSDEEQLQPSTANEIDDLQFDSEGEEIIAEIIESQAHELQFDSDAEDFIDFLTKSEDSPDDEDTDVESEELVIENKEEPLQKKERNEFVLFSMNKKNSCSLSCKQNCEDLISQQWSTEDVKDLNDLFKSMKKIEIKNFMLEHIKKQHVMGLTMSGFLYNGHLFCFRSFEKLTGVSKYLVDLVITAAENKLEKFEHGSQGSQKFSVAKVGYIVWMKSFALSYGQYSPDELVIVLPGHLRMVDVWKYYESEAPEPRVKASTFYSMFKQIFSHKRADRTLPWIRLSVYSSHSRCDSCLVLDQKRRKAKSLEELNFIKSLSYKHMESQNRSRIHIQTLRQLCLAYPAEYLMFQLDDMDNQKGG